MDKIQKLKDKMAENAAAMQAILDAVPEGANLSDEQQAKFDALVADNSSAEKQIGNLEAAEVAKKKAENMATRPAPVVPTRPVASAPGEVPANRVEQVIPANVRRGGTLKNFKNDEYQAYSFGQWIRACNKIGAAAQWCADHGIPLAVHTEGSNTGGGYLVPAQFENTLIDLRLQYGVFRQNAGIKQMTSDTLPIPRRATGNTAYWVGESTAITESDKTWTQVKLIAKKLGVLTRMSNELSEDAIISVADDLAGEFALALAYAEDMAGFLGDGTSTYGGITGTNTILKSTVGATTASAGGITVSANNTMIDFTLKEHQSVLGRCPGYAKLGAKWYCSPFYFETVMSGLVTAAGGTTTTELINGVMVPKFLGYPVIQSEVFPSADVNSQIYCIFGNLAMAAKLGDRRMTTMAFSDSATIGGQSVFERDEIAVRGTERLDIVTHDVGTSTVAGPIVGLQGYSS